MSDFCSKCKKQILNPLEKFVDDDGELYHSNCFCETCGFEEDN